MSGIVASIVCALAVAYFARMVRLQFRLHEWSFVAQHAVSGSACLYSAYSLWANGWGVLEVAAPLMAALYLIRSHSTYIEATGPGELGTPIHRVFGGHQQ